MNAGQLQQVATPSDIYEHPNSRWVAAFIGDINLIEGKVVSTGLGHTMIDSQAGGRLMVTADATPGATVTVALRPEKARIDPISASPASDENCFSGRMTELGYLGGLSVYKIKLDNGLEMKATVTNRTRPSVPSIGLGDRVWFSFPPEAGSVLLR